VVYESLSESSTKRHRGQSLSELVPDTSQREAIQNALAGRRGLLVFCGAPGSGLTTTLYAALREVDTAELNVLTIEDPVERQLEGIDQIEVDPAAGVTAASGLRAILASDPDVVALARSSTTRRRQKRFRRSRHPGSDDTRRADSVGGSSPPDGARRRLGSCERDVDRRGRPADRSQDLPHVPGDLLRIGGRALRARLAGGGVRDASARTRSGLRECGDSGYQGDTRLVEVLPLTDEVRALIAAGSSAAEVERAAGAAGMRAFREQGIGLCLEGVITTTELRAVVNRPRRRWQS